MINRVKAEKEFMRLLGEPEPKRYKLTINSKYIKYMDAQYWSFLRKKYKEFKVVDDLSEDILYIKREGGN